MRSIALLRAFVSVGEYVPPNQRPAAPAARDEDRGREHEAPASARGPQRTQRNARIAQNLPLRRRCLFLLDSDFLQECFASANTAPAAAAAAAAAAARVASTRGLLELFARDIAAVQHAGKEDVLGAAHKMLDALSTASVPTPASLANWAEGVESLLTFLEEAPETSVCASPSPSSTTAAAVKAAITQEVPHASGPREADVDVDVAVRAVLCDLVRHLYEAGAVYYEHKRTLARSEATEAAAITTRKRSRDDGDADGASSRAACDVSARVVKGEFPMRVTWSVAAPVAGLLPDLYSQ